MLGNWQAIEINQPIYPRSECVCIGKAVFHMAEDSRFACKYTDEESEGEMEKNWKMFDIQWNNICSGTYKMCNDIIVYIHQKQHTSTSIYCCVVFGMQSAMAYTLIREAKRNQNNKTVNVWMEHAIIPYNTPHTLLCTSTICTHYIHRTPKPPQFFRIERCVQKKKPGPVTIATKVNRFKIEWVRRKYQNEQHLHSTIRFCRIQTTFWHYSEAFSNANLLIRLDRVCTIFNWIYTWLLRV